MWDAARAWWAQQRRQDVSMDAAMTKTAEDDFVSARQRDATLTSVDFHAWLTVARLLALSLGQNSITPSVWSHMREMESRRKASLPATAP